MKVPIIFTDLDGTLLDVRYSFQPAHEALRYIQRNNMPLVIVSSKTRAEIEYYRRLLDNQHPFVSENGGGIFIPEHYFEAKPKSSQRYHSSEGHYDVIRLGTRYTDLRKTIKDMQEKGFPIKGFGDMTEEEVSLAMGLAIEEARMAKQRDFDEPFFYEGKEESMARIVDFIKMKGLNITKGRIYHLLGQSDKGKAVAILIDLFKQKHVAISSVGIGDSPNDIPMLEKVDMPIIVQKPDGTYDETIKVPRLIKTPGIGPLGWNNVITSLSANFQDHNL